MKASWRTFLRRLAARQAAGPTGPAADELAALEAQAAGGDEKAKRRLWTLELERFVRSGGDYLAVVQAAWARREGAAR